MHPAFSVLIFTVASGAGYGLIFLLILGHLVGISALQDQMLILVAGITSLIFISCGLLASTLHLTNPKNAWRAFSRFKTSWLSREAVFAILFYPFVIGYLLAIYLQGSQLNGLSALLGVMSLVIAFITLFCTSMIYASLKTIKQWNTALTPVNYIVLGLMSGSLLLLAIQAMLAASPATDLYNLAFVFLAMGAVVKSIYFYWIGKPSGSTIKTATGFTQASVRLLDQGHSSNAFLNNEFGYTVEADKLLRIRMASLGLSFLIPALILMSTSSVLLVLAVFVCLAGLLAERWLFFAEARHVVRFFQANKKD